MVSISYMGMEQQHLVDIKIITSKYGDVKKKEGWITPIYLVNRFMIYRYSSLRGRITENKIPID